MRTACLLLTIATIAISCDSAAPPESAGTPKVPETLFVTAPPAGARPLAEVKTATKPGERVVFSARVGGRVEPFVKGRAIMVVTDPGVPACSDNPDDGCTTPWDYCCETPESMAKNTATIQAVGEAGRPLAAEFEGAHGIEPLAEVVVTGAVVSGGADEQLLVNVESIWVRRE